MRRGNPVGYFRRDFSRCFSRRLFCFCRLTLWWRGFFFRRRPPQYKQFADVLYRRARQRIANFVEHGGARSTIIVEHAHFNQFMRFKRARNFAQNRRSQPMLTDHDYRIKMMRTRP